MSQTALTVETADSRLREARRARIAARFRKYLTGTTITIVGLIVFILIAFPNLWLLDTSFKANDDAWAIPPQYIPLHPTLDKYIELLGGGAGVQQTRELQYWYLYLLNSIYVSTIPALLATAIATLAGYGFARFRLPGGTFMLMFLLVGQMFPGPSLFVPIYFLVNYLGLYDSLNALIIIYTAFHIPMGTWLATGFFRSIPLELEEAARIDGCSLLQSLLYVALPLAKIGILTIALLGFMAFWGEFGFASIILESQSKFTATLGLVKQITQITTTFNTIGAAATLMGLPMLVFLMILQRQFVRGLTAGALKES